MKIKMPVLIVIFLVIVVAALYYVTMQSINTKDMPGMPGMSADSME
jgi:hypothetical protein